MKKIKLVMTAVFVITGFIACKNSPTKAQQDAMNLNSYVDSIEISPRFIRSLIGPTLITDTR
jgi:hypothetical protein